MLRRYGILLSCIALCAGAAAAQDSTLKACAGISMERARLLCYDRLAGRAAPEEDESRTAVAGGWTMSETVNPLDDTKSVVIRLDAEEPTAGGRPTLLIRCRNKELDVFIDWDEYVGSSNTRVTTRLDTLKAESRSWLISSGGTATFAPGNVANFIKALLTSRRLIAGVTPYRDPLRTAPFVLEGLDQAIVPVRAACPWR